MVGNKNLLVGFSVLLIAGAVYFSWQYGLPCLLGVAGGGGSTHIPPQISPGQPIVLELEHSRWGASQCFGDIADDYSEVRCHYKLKGEPNYHAMDMQMVKKERDRVWYQCEIPYPAGPDQVEYYFDSKMNDVYNRRDEKPLTIK